MPKEAPCGVQDYKGMGKNESEIMKTKFTINDEIFGNKNLETLPEYHEYYEKYYKDDGWLLDKEMEDVYMILDKEIQLNIGDYVSMHGLRKVTWKCVYPIDDIIEYALEEE